MASVTWPSKFPAPFLMNYRYQAGRQFLRTQMDDGHIRQRRQYRSELDMLIITWRMKADIYKLFEGWFVYKINAGTDWFNMAIQTGDGFKTNEVRFSDIYTSKPLSHDLWEVTGTLDIRDLGIIDESTLDTALV